jgi:O-antigen/teichoic acid export membrane protein
MTGGMTASASTEIESPEILADPIVAPSRSLAKRVRSGFSWNVASALITETIRFVRSIILARLLVPEAFGLFAMALTILGASNAISTLGLSRTIVAHQFDSKDQLRAHLDTVWTVELIRSSLVTLLVFASAIPMSTFYGEPQLKWIIPILGLTTLVEAFRNVGLNILRKQISFARIFWFEITTTVTGLVLSVGLAFFFRNVWALVLGLLLTSAIGTVMYWSSL